MHIQGTITLYWLTNTGATFTRLYYKAQHAEGMLPSGYVDTPPEERVRRCCNLTRFTSFEQGGHFVALERPEDLVREIRAFFRPLRS